MNNGEQVTGTGRSCSAGRGRQEDTPYKEEKLVKMGVVEVTLNNEPAGQTLFT